MKDSDFQQLNIVYTERDKVWAYCIYHNDVIRPNLSISLLDEYYGRYKCWACGKEGKLSKEQMNRLHLSTTIYKNGNNLQTRWKDYVKKCRDNLQKFPLLKLGLAKQLNVSVKSLSDWLVGYDGSSFIIPMFREDLPSYCREGGFCGVQRRFSDGTKRCVIGSHLGYMYSYNYFDVYDHIFICEGFSDGINVYDLGFNSISRPHCYYTDGLYHFFEDYSDSEFEGYTVIVPDNDDAGHKGADELYKILRYYYDCSIFSLPSDVKDIREYIAKVGKEQAKKELAKWV